ncbi:hypothetical protein [Streptomyces sp. NBC_00425]|uniref:hypothetical protein n=1 Tax=Streptomyces sp. NBC_00425 TaxID=2975740 RepID=UPI002E24799C
MEASALLGDGNADLTAQAELAMQGFGFHTPENPNWALGDLAGAQCNLALIHIRSGDVDGAAQAVRPRAGPPGQFPDQRHRRLGPARPPGPDDERCAHRSHGP